MSSKKKRKRPTGPIPEPGTTDVSALASIGIRIPDELVN